MKTFISVINQLDAQNFCFTIRLFHASTCFEHTCSKHVEAWNSLIVKQKFCASSWLITEIDILRCTVSETSKMKTCLPHRFLCIFPIACCLNWYASVAIKSFLYCRMSLNELVTQTHHRHGSGGQWPVPHCKDLGSIPDQSMCDLWRTKWHWDTFLSKYFSSSWQYHCTSSPSTVDVTQ